MYSPKISEKLIPEFYQLKQLTKTPMTKLVNEAIAQYLQRKDYSHEQQTTQKIDDKFVEKCHQSAVQSIRTEEKEKSHSKRRSST